MPVLVHRTAASLTSVLMTLANMRENGVRSISATCETCQHEAVLNGDRWPADMPVPDIGLKLRCSASGDGDAPELARPP
jgi:hypothetical protein